jgi:biopolymer transport protein ExbB
VAVSRVTFGELELFSIIQAAGWPIWPLVLCSIVALALIIERFVSLKTAKVAPPRLLEEALAVSRQGLPGPDVVSQLEANSALGEVLASGMRALNSNPRCSEDELRSAIEGAGRMVAHRLERYLPAIATIASAAPLLGLMGTVIGMIEIFGAQGTGTGGGSNPAQLAHGISVALYNTAFGLIIAIPTLIFWRYFRARVDGYLLTLELSAERMSRHLMALRSGK